MLKSIAIVVLILLGIVGLIALLGAQLPVQHTASRTAQFNVSPQQLWDIISGPPTWREEVGSFEELPSRDGHRVWREFGRHGQRTTFEEVEADPPHKLVTRIADPHLPFGGTWTYEIAPTETGSTLTITEKGEVYNPVFRFVSRYLQGYTATIDSYMHALRHRLRATS